MSSRRSPWGWAIAQAALGLAGTVRRSALTPYSQSLLTPRSRSSATSSTQPLAQACTMAGCPSCEGNRHTAMGSQPLSPRRDFKRICPVHPSGTPPRESNSDGAALPPTHRTFGRPTHPGAGVHVGAVVQEKLGHCRVALLACDVKRSEEVTLRRRSAATNASLGLNAGASRRGHHLEVCVAASGLPGPAGWTELTLPLTSTSAP